MENTDELATPMSARILYMAHYCDERATEFWCKAKTATLAGDAARARECQEIAQELEALAAKTAPVIVHVAFAQVSP